MLAQIGESWSGYTILEALGHTGMAELYRVRREDGRTRLLHVVAIQHPQLIARLQEADLDVVHPNVLGVTDVFSIMRFPGLVSADLIGMPLGKWMSQNPSLDQRLQVFRGIAAGTAALHAAGITHGYLQPEGVIVEVRRGVPCARLALPGVAQAVFSIIREGGAVTSSGASLGGPSFQAPEQQRSPAAAGLRSDVFQLGCLLYYLVTSRSPFQGLDLMDCYEAARTETYPPLDARRIQTLPGLEDLVRDLLHADPAERPSAREVVERMERVFPEPVPSMVPIALGISVVLAVVVTAAFLVLG